MSGLNVAQGDLFIGTTFRRKDRALVITTGFPSYRSLPFSDRTRKVGSDRDRLKYFIRANVDGGRDTTSATMATIDSIDIAMVQRKGE